MKSICQGLVGAICLGTFLLGASALSAQCNWAARAEASVSGGTSGQVTTSHFGQLTRVDCVNSRDTVLQAQTLHNGNVAKSQVQVGPPAVLGAHISLEQAITTCSGQWSGTTRFGTRFLGVNSWLTSAVSGVLTASCPPPPPPPPPWEKPPPCSEGEVASSTWTLSSGDSPELATFQSGFGQSRFERRPEGHFLLDEWAILSMRGGSPKVRFASTAAFRDLVTERVDPQMVERYRDSVFLVVEAADHPLNGRHIPLPKVIPLDVELEKNPEPVEAEMWFRAEIDAQGRVDRVTILEASGLAAQSRVEKALRRNLELDYADTGRHRAVVFGVAAVTAAGRMTVDDPFVVLPQCCCGDMFCE